MKKILITFVLLVSTFFCFAQEENKILIGITTNGSGRGVEAGLNCGYLFNYNYIGGNYNRGILSKYELIRVDYTRFWPTFDDNCYVGVGAKLELYDKTYVSGRPHFRVLYNIGKCMTFNYDMSLYKWFPELNFCLSFKL